MKMVYRKIGGLSNAVKKTTATAKMIFILIGHPYRKFKYSKSSDYFYGL